MTTLATPPETDTVKRRPLGTAEQVSELLSVPVQSVYELGRTGKVPGVVRLGRRMRFDLDKLEAWLEGQGSPS